MRPLIRKTPLSWGQIFFMWLGGVLVMVAFVAGSSLVFEKSFDMHEAADSTVHSLPPADTIGFPSDTANPSVLFDIFNRTYLENVDSTRQAGFAEAASLQRTARILIGIGALLILSAMAVLAFLLMRSFHASARPAQE